MLNDIMDAVTRRLDELFGDGYRIYPDPVKQGLEEPCFFVQFLEPSEKQMIGPRYYRKTDICIQYMPGDVPQPSRELNRVSDILMYGMEYITSDDGSQLRGTGMKARPDMDVNVLTFLVSYNMYVIKQEQEKETMENVKVN